MFPLCCCYRKGTDLKVMSYFDCGSKDLLFRSLGDQFLGNVQVHPSGHFEWDTVEADSCVGVAFVA